MTLLLAILAATVLSVTDASRTPPAPNCIDARDVRQAGHVDARTMAVATGSGRYRLELASDCPGVIGLETRLLAKAGWVCGNRGELVQVGDTRCSIVRTSSIGSREYARLSRQSKAREIADGDAVLLEAVERSANRRASRGFDLSYEWCFDPRYLRGWMPEGGGIVVETSPKRSGGYRRYRLELGRRCPGLHHNPRLVFRSGVGLSLICGNIGDTAITLVEDPLDRFARARIDPGGNECPVIEVYPVER